MISRKAVSSTLFIITVSFLMFGCSDVQNREPKSKSEPNKSSVSIKVVGRFTTTGAQTSDGFDEDLEKKITKNLSQVLISGNDKANLFTQEASGSVEGSFPNLAQATKNNAEVSFNYFNAETDTDKIVVVSFTQEATLKNNKVSNSGKIYFDTQGKIIGFNIPDQPLTQGSDQ